MRDSDADFLYKLQSGKLENGCYFLVDVTLPILKPIGFSMNMGSSEPDKAEKNTIRVRNELVYVENGKVFLPKKLWGDYGVQFK